MKKPTEQELVTALENLTKEIDLKKLNIRKDFSLILAHNCALKAIYNYKNAEPCNAQS